MNDQTQKTRLASILYVLARVLADIETAQKSEPENLEKLNHFQAELLNAQSSIEGVMLHL